MRLLVTGGRDFADRARLEAELERIDAEHCIDVVIHGAASGADTIAEQWAQRRGCPSWPFPAEWKTHGRAAGPIRNARMLEEARPTHFLAMPGGAGTADMIAKARAAGLWPA